MLIEFSLPTGAGGMAASHHYRQLKAEIERWTSKYNITYTDKLIKYTYRVCFEDDKDYSLFQLTWNPGDRVTDWGYRYRIITDRERDGLPE